MHAFLHISLMQSVGQSGPSSALIGVLTQGRASGVLNALGVHRPALLIRLALEVVAEA